jgi:cytochrome P450
MSIASLAGASVAVTDAPQYPRHPLLSAGSLLRELRKRPLEVLFEICDGCGDVARLRFPWKPYTGHLLRHPDHIRHVLLDNAPNYTKNTRGFQKLRGMFGNGLLTSEGELWKRQRRIANPAFHRQRVARFADRVVRCAVEMLESWPARIAPGAPFDVSAEMRALALRIIGFTMLSTDVASSASTVRHAIDDVFEITIRRTQNVFGLPDWVPTAENRRYSEARRALDSIVQEIIAQRRTATDPGEDLLAMLMGARDPEDGQAMSDVQLRDEVMTVFLAGHETTANTLTFTLYLLSLHPEVARRLHDEVRAVVGDRPPCFEDLEQLVYTARVVKEAMRLLPPVPIIARTVVADDVIGGYRIPGGTWVCSSPFLSHRDPRFWPNPEGFDPDRFLPEAASERPRHAYFPFGMGPHMCIGESFAMMEACLILAAVMQCFRLELVSGRPVQLDPKVTLRPKGGLWMRLGRA